MNNKVYLVELMLMADLRDEVSENTTEHREYTAELMIANGVTVQRWSPAVCPPKEKGYYLCFWKYRGEKECALDRKYFDGSDFPWKHFGGRDRHEIICWSSCPEMPEELLHGGGSST